MGDLQARHRELAYKTWREHGHNISATVKALAKEHGYSISRQSLGKWRKAFEWDDRAAREENEAREREEATSDSSILNSLISQKQKYEEYFKTLSSVAVDNQAVYGYNSVLKTILDIKNKIEERRKAGEVEQVQNEKLRKITTPEEALVALREAIEKKLNVMLSTPDTVSPKFVDDMLKALGNVDKLQARYAPDTGDDKAKKGGFTDDSADDIRRSLLGMQV
jgi:hypothetical protein